MAKYCKLFFFPFAIAAAIAGITFTGCTDVDDTLGYGLIPDNQKMKFVRQTLDTEGAIDTYLRPYGDSLSTAHMGKFRIGNSISERFGTTTCGFLSQFTFNYVERYNDGSKEGEKEGWTDFTEKEIEERIEKGLYFGYDAKDHEIEINFNFYISDILGDNTVEQKFYVYEVTELMGPQYEYHEKYPPKGTEFKQKEPVVYYRTTDPSEYANLSEPLFSFTLHNEKRGMVEDLEITVEPAGEEYLRKLVSLEEITTPENPNATEEEFKRGVLYKDSDVFRKHIRGFYIAPADNTLNAAIYEISIGQNIYRQDSYMTVSAYSRKDLTAGTLENESESDLERIRVTYDFFDDFNQSVYPNTTIGIITHDYNGSEVDVSLFYDPDKGEANQKVSDIYIQGMLGVGGYLEFNEKFIEGLDDLLIDDEGNEWQAMMVNKAIMKIWMDNDAIPLLDKAPVRLGMYYQIIGKGRFSFPYMMSLKSYKVSSLDDDGNNVTNTVEFKDFMPIGIPDYLYQYEGQANLSYGGYLVRSEGHGYYEMNISSLISSLINYKNQTDEYKENNPYNRGIWLTPALTLLTSDGSGKSSVNTNAIFNMGEVLLKNENHNVSEQAKRIEIELSYTLLKPKQKESID